MCDTVIKLCQTKLWRHSCALLEPAVQTFNALSEDNICKRKKLHSAILQDIIKGCLFKKVLSPCGGTHILWVRKCTILNEQKTANLAVWYAMRCVSQNSPSSSLLTAPSRPLPYACSAPGSRAFIRGNLIGRKL